MENFEQENILVAESLFYSDGQIYKFAWVYKKKPFSLSGTLGSEIEMLVWSEGVRAQLVGVVCSCSFFTGLPSSLGVGQTLTGSRAELVFQLSGTSARRLHPTLVCCGSLSQKSNLVSPPPVRAFLPDLNRPKPSFLDSQVNFEQFEEGEWILSPEEQLINDFIIDRFTEYPSLEEDNKFIPPRTWFKEFCKEKNIPKGSTLSPEHAEHYVDFVHRKFLAVGSYKKLNKDASPLDSLREVALFPDFKKLELTGPQKMKLQASFAAALDMMPDDLNVKKLDEVFPEALALLDNQFHKRVTPIQIEATRSKIREVFLSITPSEMPVLSSYSPVQRKYAPYFYFIKKLQQELFKVPRCLVSASHQAHVLDDNLFGLNILLNKVLLHEIAHAIIHEIQYIISPETAPPHVAKTLFAAGMQTILDHEKRVKELLEYQRAAIASAKKINPVKASFLKLDWANYGQTKEAFNLLNEAVSFTEKNKYFRAYNKELIACMASVIGSHAGGAAGAGIALGLGYAKDVTSLAFYHRLGSSIGSDMLKSAALTTYEQTINNTL